jgi:hypothetical protein
VASRAAAIGSAPSAGPTRPLGRASPNKTPTTRSPISPRGLPIGPARRRPHPPNSTVPVWDQRSPWRAAMCSNTDRRCDGRPWVTTHLDTPTDLLKRVGQSLGTTDWMKITQQQVDLFADTTGDHQWIHTDRARGQRSLQGHHRARLSDPVAGAGGHRARAGDP